MNKFTQRQIRSMEAKAQEMYETLKFIWESGLIKNSSGRKLITNLLTKIDKGG